MTIFLYIVIMINHFAKNMVTKGLLNISNITKGFILPGFEYVIIRRVRYGGGGMDSGMPYKGRDLEQLVKDVEEIGVEEIDYIEVYVDGYKKRKKGGKIYATLIKSKIEAELLTKFKEKPKIKIKAKLEK